METLDMHKDRAPTKAAKNKKWRGGGTDKNLFLKRKPK